MVTYGISSRVSLADECAGADIAGEGAWRQETPARRVVSLFNVLEACDHVMQNEAYPNGGLLSCDGK